MIDSEPPPTVAAPAPGLWTRACGGERHALAQLAERFWYPVYAWFRAAGESGDDAALRCRHFYSRLHAAEPPARDEPTAARFREYVLTQVKAFLVQDCPVFPGPAVVDFDLAVADARFRKEPQKLEDEVFGRAWPLRILELSILALQDEYRDNEPLFAAMKPFLGFHSKDEGYTEAARSVGMSTSAFHLQTFNFRKRYRAVLRSQIADTVRHADDVDSELTVLLVGAT